MPRPLSNILDILEEGPYRVSVCLNRIKTNKRIKKNSLCYVLLESALAQGARTMGFFVESPRHVQ